MKNFRKCHTCKLQWQTLRHYLKDDNIIFVGTKDKKGIKYFIFTCLACGSKHEIKAELAKTLEPDVRGLLIYKLQFYIDNLSGKNW